MEAIDGENDSNSSPTSIGIEFVAANSAWIEPLIAKGLIDHLQVSIPANFDVLSVLGLTRKYPFLKIVLHSEYLDVFGENNWQRLVPIAKYIQQLKPVMVIEHFSSYRPPCKSGGLQFPTKDMLKDKVQLAIDNVSRWRDLLGTSIHLENIPINRDVDLYLSRWLSIADACQVDITCDFSHLLISMHAGDLSDSQVQVADACCDKATHVHVAGLRRIGNLLLDNHNSFPNWLIKVASNNFPNKKMLTLENAPNVDPAYLTKAILKCRQRRRKFNVQWRSQAYQIREI